VSAKNEKINIRLPSALLDEVDARIREGSTTYSDRTDFIKCAIRKELDRIDKKGQQLIMDSQG
jgi:metal-responsive CopG/Arc/MetJ family transcriptional regulator